MTRTEAPPVMMTEPITPAQRRALFAAGRTRGLTIDDIREMTPTGSISALTRCQASDLLDGLNRGTDYAHPRKRKPRKPPTPPPQGRPGEDRASFKDGESNDERRLIEDRSIGPRMGVEDKTILSFLPDVSGEPRFFAHNSAAKFVRRWPPKRAPTSQESARKSGSHLLIALAPCLRRAAGLIKSEINPAGFPHQPGGPLSFCLSCFRLGGGIGVAV